ncbi:MAG: arginine--tRNA ligase [Candidatus Altimarinota bacterium]
MLKSDLEKLLIKAVKNATDKELDAVHVESTADPKFGDFATNIAMMLSKETKKNPRELAQSIIDALPNNDLIAKTDIAGPGFINFWLQDSAYRQTLEELNKKIEAKTFGELEIGKGQKAVTDSSHPNVAKPMGVHHLLSTILGQSINNLLKKSGYEVVRDNYLGDWGTQFGKLTYAIRTWGDMKKIEADPIPELLKLYVKFHDEVEQEKKNSEAVGSSSPFKGPGVEGAKESPLEERGRAEFKKLEDGDPENRKLWNWIRDLSLVEFETIWKRLGVEFDLIHGESFYEDKMKTILEDGLRKKVIEKGEGGALIIKMNDENIPPCLLQKSDGATTYATRDLARMKYWQDEIKADLGVNLVDVAQKLHFDQIFEAAEKLGINKMKHIHVEFGRMEFPEGGMSTRKGKVVLLEDVLNEAERRAAEKIKEHNSPLSDEEQVQLARIMGIGAVKYNILSQNRQKNYTFVWDQMLSFEGNSAPYLQYAYARIKSIEKRAIEREIELNNDSFHLSHEKEKSLFKKIIAFEEAISGALINYKPNILCTYLFELAQTFSSFYNDLPILSLNSDLMESHTSRLKLSQNTGYVLKSGLEILGIEVPERM